MTRPMFRPKGEPAKCPFCEAVLPRPKPRPHHITSLLPGGRCACGALFVVDPTGRNGGTALLEALEDMASGDRDRVLCLERGKDYDEFIENYDPRPHQYIRGFRGYRRGMARLYLVRLREKASPPPAPPSP